MTEPDRSLDRFADQQVKCTVTDDNWRTIAALAHESLMCIMFYELILEERKREARDEARNELEDFDAVGQAIAASEAFENMQRNVRWILGQESVESFADRTYYPAQQHEWTDPDGD